ncbi:hypothetical protein GCM10023322_72800 [Rugosimonospora acidiphila]|uniref:Uncharacterized protein n=1 Tax=Rugosimonospora acidiphila TaxID=556531 RepID=A0ABP9SLN7_9ACTN
MIGPEHLHSALENAIPVPPEQLSRPPLSAIGRRIRRRRRRTAVAAVAAVVAVVAAGSVAWLAGPHDGAVAPAVRPSSGPSAAGSTAPSPAGTGPVAPPTSGAGVAVAWRTASVDAAGTTVTLGLDTSRSDAGACRTVTAIRTGGDASEIVLTAYRSARPGTCDDSGGAVATVRLGSALGDRVLIDGADGRSRPVLRMGDLPVPAGLRQLIPTADPDGAGWTLDYTRSSGLGLVLYAVPTQNRLVPDAGDQTMTVPGHTLDVGLTGRYNASWAAGGWWITLSAERLEGTGAITLDQFETLIASLPWG